MLGRQMDPIAKITRLAQWLLRAHLSNSACPTLFAVPKRALNHFSHFFFPLHCLLGFCKNSDAHASEASRMIGLVPSMLL